MPNQEPARQARLEARLPLDVHAMLKRAAEIEGRTLTDFVISAATDAARKSIEESQIIRLSVADQRAFVEMLLNPPPLSPALERAKEHHERLFGKL